MTQNSKQNLFIDTSTSNAYMYKVTMVVQVIAPNKELADMKLDQDGGYVSKRTVDFVRSTPLYNEKEEEAEAKASADEDSDSEDSE